MLLQSYIYAQDVSSQPETINSNHDNIAKVIHITEGKGSVLINDNVYNLEANSVYIIDSGSLYYFSIKADEPFRVNVLNLDRNSVVKTIQGLGQSFEEYCDKIYILDNIGSDKIKDIFSHVSLFAEPTDIFVTEKLLTLLRVCTENSKRAAPKSTAVNRILKYINENLCKRLDLDIISESLHSSIWYLCHTFKETTGFTIKEYIRLARIRKAETLLTTTDYSISAISEMCGFENFSFFSRVFSKEKGLTPSVYRRNNSTPDSIVHIKRSAASATNQPTNQYRVCTSNPIIPAYEYTTIDLCRVFLDLFGATGYSGANLYWESNAANLIFDNQKHLLTVGAVGTYRATARYKDIKRDIAICVIPHNTSTESSKYEVTLFEYDFDDKSTDEILKDWVFQTRPNNLSGFLPPEYPKAPLKSSKKGFIPFPAAYKDDNGEIKHNCFNFPKGPTNVGFMYLKTEHIPSLFQDYRIYCTGTLTGLAKNVPDATVGSTAAKAGLVGRIRTNFEQVLDYNSGYQATLVSIADHPLYKLRDSTAHQNIFLTENLFFEFGYDSETPKYFGANIPSINVGDSYTIMADFKSSTIVTGIKKGSMDDGGKFATREIFAECSQLTNGVNYIRTNRIHSYTATAANLCIGYKGTVGFAFMGAETAIKKFKVTHTVNTANIPTISYMSSQKIDELVKKRQRSLPTPAKATSLVPKRYSQKELNVRHCNPFDIERPENRLAKFCILSNMHLSHKSYFSDFENNSLYKKNFLSFINSSDTEFLVSCGDNLMDGHDYTYESCVKSYKNLSAFYNLMSHLPDKDFFALKGNCDHSVTDFADNFIIKEKNITIIGFYAQYIEYQRSQNRFFLASGILKVKTLEWLKNACENAITENPDTHIIFLCHFSAIDSINSSGFAEDGFSLLADSKRETAYRNELLDIITAYGVELFISGHEDNNHMHYSPIYYNTGYNTGCINYITGNTPVDCTLSVTDNGQTAVTMEQYFYGDFTEASSRPKKSLIKTLGFELTHPKSDGRLENAKKFFAAKKKLTDTFSGRFDGLYRYSFAYCGTDNIDGKEYYKFDVSILKYYIFNGSTIYADSDEEINSPNITAHLFDAYIPSDASFIGELTDDGVTPIKNL